MKNKKQLLKDLSIIVGTIGICYFFYAKEMHEEFVVFISCIMVFQGVESFQTYFRELKKYQKDKVLEINEKWDFLYQDILVPFVFVFLILIVIYTISNYATFSKDELQMLFPVVFSIQWLFTKLILRNKLIIDGKEIIYSEYGIFETIGFREVDKIELDEDGGILNLYFGEDEKKKINKYEIANDDWIQLIECLESIFQTRFSKINPIRK